jgi:uncharacterized membrane protein YheB (UPF0754 family)
MTKYEECAKAIGEMIMTFQQMENTLVEYFAAICNTKIPEIGYSLASEMTFAGLCKKILKLTKQFVEDDELNEVFAGIMQQCDKVRNERNTYIHSNYFSVSFQEGLEVYARQKHRVVNKKYIPDIEDVDIDKINDLTNRINSIDRELEEFFAHGRKTGAFAKFPKR